jgi:RNA-directed DNA polymerase
MQEISRASGIATPDHVRELQRSLYRKAKQEPGYRFYTLYDKVCRRDVLEAAYMAVRANGGSAGVDGQSIAALEAEPGKEAFLGELEEALRGRRYRAAAVRRVYLPKPGGGERPLGIPTIRDRVVQAAVKMVIEPVFEADFTGNSYGFRPKRSAHQALKDIQMQMVCGRTDVLDADLRKYFDSIPHGPLLVLVARRIADRNILKLIRQWLKAPVAGVRSEGTGPRQCGTPQGGVISPLLGNIYLHELDRHWRDQRLEERWNARLVRYADDFVILCRGTLAEVRAEVDAVIGRLGLSVNTEKTRHVDTRREPFEFLGFELRMRRSSRTGRAFAMTRPSRASCQRIRDRIRELTGRDRYTLPPRQVIDEVNRSVRGWVQYFRFGNCTRDLWSLWRHLYQRIRGYICRRKRRYPWNRAISHQMLIDLYGLQPIPLSAPWRDPAHAVR